MGDTQSTLFKEHLSTWDDSDVIEWKKIASAFQKNFYLAFEGKQWDAYESHQYDLLRVKICYAVYGPPDEANNNMADIEKAYNSDQREYANNIKTKIIEVYEKYSKMSLLQVGIIFVHCKEGSKQNALPIFRVRIDSDDSVSYYIDTSLRVYSSWEDWQNNNKFPMLKYCFPKRGYYTCSGNSEYKFARDCEPDLAFGTSPACDLTSRLARLGDVGGETLSIASATVGAVGLFTPLAPVVLLGVGIVGTTTASYGAVRCVQRLVDKGTHDESLADFESVMCGLSILMAPMHIGTSVVNNSLAAGARAGRTFTSLRRLGATILNLTTFGLDCSVMVMGIVNLCDKASNRKLEPLDVLQFSISVFFFTHTLIQPKTASGIIKSAQSQYFNEYKSQMTDADAQKAFDTFVQENNKSMKEGARVVKTINHIRDPNTFFKSVGDQGASVTLGSRSGKTVMINNELRISPNRFNQLQPEQGKRLLNITKQYQGGQISEGDYTKYYNEVMRDERLAVQARRRTAINKIAAALGTDESGLKNVRINDKLLFADLKDADIDRLRTVMGDTARNYNSDIINAAIAATAELDVHNISDFGAVIELVVLESRDMTRGEFKSYVRNLQTDANLRRQFADGVLRDSGNAAAIIQDSDIKFSNPIAAAYHYRKHGAEFGRSIQMKMYLDDIPRDVFQEKYLFRDVYDQSGSTRIQTYANPDGYKFGVLRVNEDGTQRVATVFSNQKFFDNWTEKLAGAKHDLLYTTKQYDMPLPQTPTSLDMFARNLLFDMGFTMVNVSVHNDSKTVDLNSFNGSTGDMEKIRLMADTLASLG